ncbi:MAG TPA: hypothetical protein VIL00_08210 [Pseudonocardiaceae bacterium]
MHSDPELGCHELLLRLAGRLPDELLWRYRDWLAGGAVDVLVHALPRALLRDRIGLTEAEYELLGAALLPLGADRAAVLSVSLLDDTGGFGLRDWSFTADDPRGGGGDQAAVVLGAAMRGRPGVREVRCSWRYPAGGDPDAAKRVILVTTSASAEVVALTGELQRVLRALGEHEPCVEVLPADYQPSPYHQEALDASILVCAGADSLASSGA